MSLPRRLREDYDRNTIKTQIKKADPTTPQVVDYSRQALNRAKQIGLQKSKSAKWWADFFRYMNVFISVWIVMAAGTIFVLELMDDCQNIGKLILTGTIVVFKTCHGMFQIGNRGSFFKYIYIRLNSMLEDIEEAKLFLRNSNEIILFSRHIREEMDKLDIEMYKLTSGPEMVTTTIDGNVEYDFKKASDLV